MNYPAVTPLHFSTGVTARMVRVDPTTDPADALDALEVPHGRPVLVLCGGAVSTQDNPVRRAVLPRVLGPAVLEAACRTGAVVVDGATDAGVRAVVGQAAARFPERLPLVGVAPEALVSLPRMGGDNGGIGLEPHHNAFVLTPGEHWGAETPTLISLAAAAAEERPIVVVLAGGGLGALAEVDEAVRQGWPVVLLEGTGGLADVLVERWHGTHSPAAGRGRLGRLRRRSDRAGDASLDDTKVAAAALDALVGAGSFRRLPLVRAADLADALEWELQDHRVLADAWERFARYDAAAVELRRSSDRAQLAILGLGLLVTLLALVLRTFTGRLHGSAAWVGTALHWTVVALPLLAASVLAFSDRFALGKRWALLRGAAEIVKGEIYWYRTGTGLYARSAPPEPPADRRLAARLQAVANRLMGTEVGSAEPPRYLKRLLPPPESWTSGTDDGFSYLDPDRYLRLRVGDQLTFYRARTQRLSGTLKWLQVGILLAGAAGALVAAAGGEIWVALTTAVGGALAVHRGHLQMDSTVVAYNQAASRLENLALRWKTVPVEQRSALFPWLVEQAETVLQTELGGWVQQMSDPLLALHRDHVVAGERAGGWHVRPAPAAADAEPDEDGDVLPDSGPDGGPGDADGDAGHDSAA